MAWCGGLQDLLSAHRAALAAADDTAAGLAGELVACRSSLEGAQRTVVDEAAAAEEAKGSYSAMLATLEARCVCVCVVVCVFVRACVRACVGEWCMCEW